MCRVLNLRASLHPWHSFLNTFGKLGDDYEKETQEKGEAEEEVSKEEGQEGGKENVDGGGDENEKREEEEVGEQDEEDINNKKNDDKRYTNPSRVLDLRASLHPWHSYLNTFGKVGDVGQLGDEHQTVQQNVFMTREESLKLGLIIQNIHTKASQRLE